MNLSLAGSVSIVIDSDSDGQADTDLMVHHIEEASRAGYLSVVAAGNTVSTSRVTRELSQRRLYRTRCYLSNAIFQTMLNLGKRFVPCELA
mgnify:FL=1